MSIAATQLTLKLASQDNYQLDNFLFASAELETTIRHFAAMTVADYLYLIGDSGSGKTHLLLACAEQWQRDGQQAIYLSLSNLTRTASPEILNALEQADLLCLDDMQAIAGNSQWQEALFHCFNRLQTSGGHLLVAADRSPIELELELEDLRSRLAAGLIYQLPKLTDEQKQQALVVQARAYGLDMTDEVAQFILRHYGRDMPSLISCVQQLDRTSLQVQRKLTIPFVKQALAGE